VEIDFVARICFLTPLSENRNFLLPRRANQVFNAGMKKPPESKSVGFAGILAQAPAASTAFGKWPGFVLVLTAMLLFFALGVITMVLAVKEAAHIVG
jgi:hypothetical protein